MIQVDSSRDFRKIRLKCVWSNHRRLRIDNKESRMKQNKHADLK